MANITNFLSTQVKTGLGGQMVMASNRIDYSEVNTAASDTVSLLTIPANALVTDFRINVRTVEDSTLTADFGILVTDPNGFDGTRNMETVGWSKTDSQVGVADAYAFGYQASTDTIISATHSANAADTCIYDVFAIYALPETVNIT